MALGSWFENKSKELDWGTSTTKKKQGLGSQLEEMFGVTQEEAQEIAGSDDSELDFNVGPWHVDVGDIPVIGDTIQDIANITGDVIDVVTDVVTETTEAGYEAGEEIGEAFQHGTEGTVGDVITQANESDVITDEEIDQLLAESEEEQMARLEELRSQYLDEIQEKYGLEEGASGRPYADYLASVSGKAEIERWYQESLTAINRGLEEQKELLLGGQDLARLGEARRDLAEAFQDIWATNTVEFVGPIAPEPIPDIWTGEQVEGERPSYEVVVGLAEGVSEEAALEAYTKYRDSLMAEALAIGTADDPGDLAEQMSKYGAPEEDLEELFDYGSALYQQISALNELYGQPEEFLERLEEMGPNEIPSDWWDRVMWGWEEGGGLGKVGLALYAGTYGDTWSSWLDPVTRWIHDELELPWSAALYEAYTYLPGYQRGEEEFREAGGTPEIMSLGGVVNPWAWGRGIWEAVQSGNIADIPRSMAGIMYGSYQTGRQREKTQIYEELGEPSGWALGFTHPVWIASMFIGVGEGAAVGKYSLRGIAKGSTRLQATRLVAGSTKLTKLVKVGEAGISAPIRGGVWGAEFAGRTGGRLTTAAMTPVKVAAKPATKAITSAKGKLSQSAVLQAAKRSGIEVAKVTDSKFIQRGTYVIEHEGKEFYARDINEVAHYVRFGNIVPKELQRYYIPSTGQIIYRSELTQLPKGTKYFNEMVFRAVEKPNIKGLSEKLWAQGINKFNSDAIVQTAHLLRLSSMQSLETFVDVALENTIAKMLVGKFREVPGLRTVINKINPNAFVTKDEKVLAAAAGWHQMGATWEMMVKGRMAHLKKMEPIKVEVKVEGGITKPIVKGVNSIKEGVEPYIGEVMQHPEWFEMTDAMRNTIKACHQVLDDARAALKKFGIEINELGFEEGGHYFPRYVLGKGGKVIETRSFKGGKRFMSKETFQKTRMYDMMKEGIDNGVVYASDPMAVMEAHLMAVGRRISDAEFARMMKPMGLTVTEMVELMSPGARTNVVKLKILKGNRQYINGLIKRAERGERLHPSTMSFIERTDKGVYDQLRALYDGQVIANRQFWDGLKAGAKKNAENTDILFYKAKDKLAKITEQAKNQPPWGRNLTSKAKPQIEKWVKEGKDPETYEPLRRLQELVRKAEGFEGTSARHVENYAFQGTWFPEETAAQISKVLDKSTSQWLGRIENLNQMSRFMMTGMDWGAGFIQGLPLLFLNPAKWGEAQARSMEVFLANMVGKGDTTYAAYLARESSQRAIAEAAASGRSFILGGGTEFTEAATKQGILGKTVMRVPGLGRGMQSYALSFEMFGDVARIEMYNSLRHMATNPSEVAQLVDFVNKATGVTSTKALGIAASQRQIEGAILLFAPRYFRATIALQADVFRGGLRGALARETLASMLSSGLLFYYATAKALGQEPNLDPRSGGFLTVEIGGNHIGIGSMWVANARFLAGCYQATVDYPDKGIPWKIWESNTRRDNPLWKYISGRVAPVTGTGIDIVTGETYIGEPLDTPYDYWQHCIQENLLPFWLDAQLSENPRPGLSAVPAEMMGMRAWALQPWEIRNDLRDQYAMQDYGVTWQQLGEEKPKDNPSKLWGKLAREDLLKKYPELQDAEIAAQERRVERGDELDIKLDNYWKEIDRLKEDRRDAYDLAVAEFAQNLEFKRRLLDEDPTLTDEEIVKAQDADDYFREKITNADMLYGEQIGNLRDDPLYADVFALFDEWKEDGDEDEYVGDRAYEEWCQVMYGNPDLEDKFGNYNYDKRDELVARFKAKWGLTVYDYVQSVVASKRDEPPVVTQYREASRYLRPYWELEDKYEGLYPDMTQEEIRAWQDKQIINALEAQSPRIANLYKRMQTDEIFADQVRASNDWKVINDFIQSVSGPIRNTTPVTMNKVVSAAKLQWRIDHPQGDEYLRLFYGATDVGEKEPETLDTGITPPDLRMQSLLGYQ